LPEGIFPDSSDGQDPDQLPRVPVRFLFRLFLLLVLAAGALGGSLYWWANQPLPANAASVDFRIPSGTGLRAAGSLIREAGIDVDPVLLSVLARAMRAENGIKAGSYAIERGITPYELLGKLTRGQVSLADITLVEGWTFRQWRSRLDRHPELRHETSGLSEEEIARRLGISAPALEGMLFPDTYLFDKQSSDLDLLARAYRTQQKRLETAWAQRAENLPYRTPYEALVMASIVEKETGRESDRPMVAAVFVNRLRTGMLLQTDPTVIYGIGEKFDGNLRKRDLLTDTPYNTYTRAGLPPTPIAMPGMASMQAALHPAASDVLYFVARGDGSSQFSRTLDEHNRAVNRYQRGGK
jgi:UPF0755 protein